MSAVTLLAQISETYSTDYFYPERERRTLQLGKDKRIYLYFCLPLWIYDMGILKAELILYAIEDCIANFPQRCYEENEQGEYMLYAMQEVFNVLGRTITPPAVSLEHSVPFTSSCSRNYSAIDITKIVQNWCSGCLENNGLLLIGTEFSLKTLYASNQHEVSGAHPVLRITFRNPKSTSILQGTPCDIIISRPLP